MVLGVIEGVGITIQRMMAGQTRLDLPISAPSELVQEGRAVA